MTDVWERQIAADGQTCLHCDAPMDPLEVGCSVSWTFTSDAELEVAWCLDCWENPDMEAIGECGEIVARTLAQSARVVLDARRRDGGFTPAVQVQVESSLSE
jgi:hypothetical protein